MTVWERDDESRTDRDTPWRPPGHSYAPPSRRGMSATRASPALGLREAHRTCRRYVPAPLDILSAVNAEDGQGDRLGVSDNLPYPPGGAAAGRPFREVLSIMREDWEVHRRDATQPGLHALLLQRYAAWRLGLPAGPRRAALSAVRHVLWILVRNVYGIELHDTARIGRRVRIVHQGRLVIDGEASIGDDSVIRHNVTIGRVRDLGGAPRIGNNVDIAPGAVLAGEITIGDRARVGANAVVISDVPADTTVFAPPARQLPNAGSMPRSSRTSESS